MTAWLLEVLRADAALKVPRAGMASVAVCLLGGLVTLSAELAQRIAAFADCMSSLQEERSAVTRGLLRIDLPMLLW